MIPRNKHSGYQSGIRLYPGWGPEAPDMSGSNRAAEAGAAISADQWAWTKERQPKLDAQADRMIQMGEDQYNLNREGQVFQQGLMKKQDDRYWDSVAPMEDKMFAEAANFDTAGRREELAGQAMGDVNQGFAGARGQSIRDLGRMGVNPSSGKSLAMGNAVELGQAQALANAANKTRTAARMEGLARKTDAIAMGKGLSGFSSNAMSSFGSGAQGATGIGMGGMGAAANQFNAGANGSAGGLQSASSNLRANAIESAKNPGFDALMGLASGGMLAWGMKK